MVRSILKNIEIIIAVGVSCLVLMGIYLFDGEDPLQRNMLEGRKAPNVEYVDSEGVERDLEEEQGSVILINFWASWCVPCLEEMPALRTLENHFRRDGLVVLGFNLGESGPKIQAEFSGPEYPQNLIFGFSKNNLKAFGIDELPMSILIRKDGVVHKVYQGKQDWITVEMIREIGGLLH